MQNIPDRSFIKTALAGFNDLLMLHQNLYGIWCNLLTAYSVGSFQLVSFKWTVALML